MKSVFSQYLESKEALCTALVKKLDESYDYVSVLATDVNGSSYGVSRRAKNIGTARFSERGFVVRVYKDGLYSEYSFDTLLDAEATATKIKNELDEQIALMKVMGQKVLETPVIEEEETVLKDEKEVEILPETVNAGTIMARLDEIQAKGFACSEFVMDFRVNVNFSHVNKMFISVKKNMKQSYYATEGSVAAIVRKDGKMQMGRKSYAGIKGAEILEEIGSDVEGVVAQGIELCSAERIVPGTYEIVCTPDVTGLITHEAFGHGVEMDMFVKNRALARDYVGKRVASDLVDMHDGALSAYNTSSYAFDDEGVVAQDTTIIKNGILVSGICDTLSALRLGFHPTGNGKRESFERKAYTRMTNTIICAGHDSVEDMIASVKDGYYLEAASGGMEDPKHWGIQCGVTTGREIKDGKFTGKIVSPLILTGYVPDILTSISMASSGIETFGAGMCGKGSKEWVKVSDGGPYLKTKVRLG